MEVIPEAMRAEFYKKTTDRHLAAKLPQEVRRYSPPEIEIIEQDKNPAKSIRRIFELNIFNSFEKEKLAKLRDEIESHNKKHTKREHALDYYPDSYLLRILYSEKFNIAQTLKSLKELVKLEAEYQPKAVTLKIMEILNSGFIYIHGRDCRYRPIVIINPKVLQKKVFAFKELCASIVYLLDYCIQQLFILGAIENWTMLVNLKDIQNEHLKEIKNVINFICEYYRSRLYKLYIINYAKKITIERIHASDLIVVTQKNQLFVKIHPSQVEMQFGGFSEDILSYFYPPIFPSKFYLNDPKDKAYLTKKITEDYDTEINDYELSTYRRTEERHRTTISAAENSARNCEISLYKKVYYKGNHSFRELDYDVEQQYNRDRHVFKSFVDTMNEDNINNYQVLFKKNKKPVDKLEKTVVIKKNQKTITDIFKSIYRLILALITKHSMMRSQEEGLYFAPSQTGQFGDGECYKAEMGSSDDEGVEVNEIKTQPNIRSKEFHRSKGFNVIYDRDVKRGCCNGDSCLIM
jgi:hypothetical protein